MPPNRGIVSPSTPADAERHVTSRRLTLAVVAAVIAAATLIVPITLADSDAAPVNTVKPALSGIARDGQAISTTDGTWTGTPPLTFTYQWLRCDPLTWLCTTVSGATSSTYTLTPADAGFKLQSSVTATNAAAQATATSYGSAVVVAAPAGEYGEAGAFWGREGRSGDLDHRRHLDGHATAHVHLSVASLRPADVAVYDGLGRDQSTYTLTPADAGFKLQSSVTATNAAGQATATSYGSAVVVAAPPVNTVKPALSGVARDGQVVSTTDGTWTGTPPLTFSYRWLRCDSVTWLSATVSGATSSTYTVTPADVGFKLQSSVTATNAAGQATASSYGSAIVGAAAPVVRVCRWCRGRWFRVRCCRVVGVVVGVAAVFVCVSVVAV